MESVQFIEKDVITSQRISNNEFRCGGYEAVNIGTATAVVNGYELAPGEGTSRMQGLGLVLVKSDIEIVINPGAKVHLTQAMYV